MADHTPDLIRDAQGNPEITHLAAGAFSVRARCCNDPRTESVLMFYVTQRTTTDTMAADKAAHLAKVQALHIALLAAPDALK
jgi:hypothetical protein